ALNTAGAESRMLGRDPQAPEYLKRATEAGPSNYKGHYNMGLLILKQQMPEEAMIQFTISLALDDYSKAYTGRATAYYLNGEITRAMDDANKSLSLVPDNAKALFVLGSCYSDLNRLDDAMAAFNKAISLSPAEAEFYFKRGIVLGK